MNISPVYHFTKEQIKSEEDEIREAREKPERFAILYNRYHERIYLYVFRRMEDADEAADVTSQVFLKAMTSLKNYQFRGLPFASWLYRIARNEMYNMFEKKKINLVVSLDDSDLGDMLGEMQEENQEQKYQVMLNAVKKLPDDEIELIEMRFFEKRSFKEIGDILGITDNNAKVRTYRVLDKLKDMLKQL
jgi:RNA polymerase sigma-70 factor (ECF subfamily)